MLSYLDEYYHLWYLRFYRRNFQLDPVGSLKVDEFLKRMLSIQAVVENMNVIKVKSGIVFVRNYVELYNTHINIA